MYTQQTFTCIYTVIGTHAHIHACTYTYTHMHSYTHINVALSLSGLTYGVRLGAFTATSTVLLS